MSEKVIKPKLPIIKKPILKKVSSFVSGNTVGPKKMTPSKDAYSKRQ